MVTKLRSVLAFVLAVVIAFSAHVSDAVAAKKRAPQTYSADQIQLIQNAATELQAMRDRMPELAKLIEDENWVFTRNFIHGPLGEIRSKTSTIARTLLDKKDQKEALNLSKEIAGHLVSIDQAAGDKNYKFALRNYSETLKDWNTFEDFIPKP